MKTKRSAIGANPLDALLRPATERKSSKVDPSASPPRASARDAKVRTTFHLSESLVDRLRNAVYWSPGLTLAELAETSLRDALSALEKKRGKPFPPREKDLRGGRPVGR